MGKYFSDVVDSAIEAIYYSYDQERAAAVLQPLAEAARARNIPLESALRALLRGIEENHGGDCQEASQKGENICEK